MRVSEGLFMLHASLLRDPKPRSGRVLQAEEILRDDGYCPLRA